MIATLIQANDVLQRDDDRLTHGAGELRAQCGQLYNSWDKILADLEVAHHGDEIVYSEKITTVRTHYVDVAAKKTEVSTDNKWVDVPQPSYRAVENDLGMVIAHKDAGLFDSEAQNTVAAAGIRLHRAAVAGLESIRLLEPYGRRKRLDFPARNI